MPDRLIIGISGLRGIVGRNLFPSVAAQYAAAFGSFLKARQTSYGRRLKVCVGRDSRPSGQMLFAAVCSGLTAVGIDVVDLGLVTTPGVGIMTRQLECAGGVVITASHNPSPYNGIKLLLDDGIAPPAELADQIIRRYHEKDISFVPSDNCGGVVVDDSTDSVHIEKVLSLVDVQAIAARRFTVVLDSVNGAGARPALKLLELLGCNVIGMNLEPTGLFAHEPEPTRENLKSLCEKVSQVGADVGFAQDPDADRLVIVDENGSYISEEYTLGFAVKYVLERHPGDITINVSTSRMIDDIAAEYKAHVLHTAVGEANVAEGMVAHNCVIGGEGNGGVIDLRVGPVRDSLVSMALTLALLADTATSVSQVVESLPKYHMIKQKINIDPQKVSSMIESAREALPDAAINTKDGCRFDYPDAWILIRPSNTEPAVRIFVEAVSEQLACAYMDKVLDVVDR